MTPVTSGALVLLCACDGVLGLHGSSLSDGRVYDSPLDGPVTCPADGTAPLFSPQLHQVPVSACDDYTVSEVGTATARCGGVLSIGNANDVLAPIAFTSPAPASTDVEPRLSPEGDLLIVRHEDTTTLSITFPIYQRNPDNTWSLVGTLPYDMTSRNAHVSTPSRGPIRHLVITDYVANQWVLVEAVGDGAAWQMTPMYPTADIGISQVATLTMTPDGTAIVFWGYSNTSGPTGVYYAQRSGVDAKFGSAQIVATVPNTLFETTPYLMQDCQRIYFGALDTVLYLYGQQPRG